jgi:hypothetical protein
MHFLNWIFLSILKIFSWLNDCTVDKLLLRIRALILNGLTHPLWMCSFSWIKISLLGKTLSWNCAIVMRFRYARYCTSLETRYCWQNNNKIVKHNRSENDHGAKVTLVHPPHLHSNSLNCKWPIDKRNIHFQMLLGFSANKLMMEAVRTSETSVDNYFTRQYIPEDNSEHKSKVPTSKQRTLLRWFMKA